MRNILKNLSGGFFRTFGRVLFYVVLGILISYFVKSNDIKITDLLGIATVKADTLQSWSVQQGRVQLDHAGTNEWSSWSNISGDNSLVFSQNQLSYPVNAIAWRVRATGGMSRENSYTFRFNYKATPDSLGVASYYFQNDTTGEQEEIACNNWRNDSGFYWYECSFSPAVSYSSTDYLYIKINFRESYLTELRMGIRGYDERKGTNAVITESTTNIINNITNATNDITNSINNSIQEQIESQQVCQYIDKKNIEKDNYMLYQNEERASTDYGITNYIVVNNGTLKLLSTYATSVQLCYYNINKTLISCDTIRDLTIGPLTIPQNAYYFRSSIRKENNQPTFSLCINGNQAITDVLTDDSSPDLSSLNDMAGWLPAGPLDSILNLPLTLLNALTTALSGTCSPITITLPYISQDLTLPCITSIYQSIGAISFVNWIGTIASAFILFKYLVKLYKWVDDTLTFRENNWLDNWGGVD